MGIWENERKVTNEFLESKGYKLLSISAALVLLLFLVVAVLLTSWFSFTITV